jgi:hypothetical protein
MVNSSTGTGKAIVIAVSRLSRFQSGIGQTTRFDGNVCGFLGEEEDNQFTYGQNAQQCVDTSPCTLGAYGP